jgi:hypothetical protein
MPALNNQSFPVHPEFKASRAAWIRGEIAAQHSALLAMIPALSEQPTARLPDVWDRCINRSIELMRLAAELAGLEA